jgi:hypothetical protein
MSFNYGFLIEIMVSILLLLTILYCVRLNRQLRLLKADEQTLRATISELITATEIAERAIAGLKSTMRDGEQNLNGRLERMDSLAAELDEQIAAGEGLLDRITRITNAGRPAVAQAAPNTKAVAAAAQALSERARARTRGIAA